MNQPKQERFKTSVGGQALMEGIMMRGPKNICCAVRKPDGTIETKIEPTPTHGIWTKIPLVRGAISMVESLIMGYRYMMYSAQVSMGDDYDPEEEETAFEKWVGDHLGKKAEDVLLGVAAVLGGLFAILLFTVLPTVLVGGVNRLLPLGRWSKVILEAVLKVAIFLSYMVAISKMKDGAILINTSRGAVLDEAAVVAALDSGKLYAVGADVFAQEPCGKNNPLASHPRCIATPHVAWTPLETRQQIIAMAGETLGAFLDGSPIHQVG